MRFVFVYLFLSIQLYAQSNPKEIAADKYFKACGVEGSVLIYNLKEKQWFTPTSYLLNGVQRQHLLSKKAIKETEITLDNIKEFTHFQLINSLNDFDDMFVYPIEKIVNLPESQDYLEI